MIPTIQPFELRIVVPLTDSPSVPPTEVPTVQPFELRLVEPPTEPLELPAFENRMSKGNSGKGKGGKGKKDHEEGERMPDFAEANIDFDTREGKAGGKSGKGKGGKDGGKGSSGKGKGGKGKGDRRRRQ